MITKILEDIYVTPSNILKPTQSKPSCISDFFFPTLNPNSACTEKHNRLSSKYKVSYWKELQDRNDELEARLHGGAADRGR